MLILSLTAVARAPVRIQGEVSADDPMWAGTGWGFAEPLRYDLEARTVGDGVLVRGTIEAVFDMECRRCLIPVAVPLKDRIDLLYETLSPEEEVDLTGEVYPLPDRGDSLDLTFAVREQVVLRAPDFVVCSQGCRGLCPSCGADLNRVQCECIPEAKDSPWNALKNIKFD